MAEIVIFHANEDQAAAWRLAEAIARAGYAVSPIDAEAEGATERIAAAGAAIVLWSQAAAASEAIRAEANVARGLKRLVQVSADGRPPPLPFDPAQSVSILTWQGEADHPAWRGIEASLRGLCGPPVEATASVPAPPAAELTPPPAPPETLARPAPAARGPSGLLIVAIVLLILAALAAGWFMLRDEGAASGPAPSLELNGVAPAAAPDAQPGPAPAPEERFDREAVVSDPSGHALVRNAASGLGFVVDRLDAGARVATYEQSGMWWRVRTASGRTGYMLAASLRLDEPGAAPVEPAQASEPGKAAPRAERRPRGSRIRKENSAVMVQFCAGAGRGTRECRRFRQLDR